MIIKKLLKWIAIFFSLFVILLMYQYWQNSITWSGVIYSSLDARKHESLGVFESLETCKIALDKRVKEKPMTREGANVDRYFCGRGCSVYAEFGSIMVDEYHCDEKIITKIK